MPTGAAVRKVANGTGCGRNAQFAKVINEASEQIRRLGLRDWEDGCWEAYRGVWQVGLEQPKWGSS